MSRPPDTTAAWVPMIDAAMLASAFPISGPPVTTRRWIDDTRPRSASGVRICTIELRSTALMTSAPADRARNPSASGKLNVASPKPMIARPQTATAISTARPGRRTVVVQPLNSAPSMAPKPTADHIRPTPAAPTMNTSRASAGNSELGHPKTIALMSTTNVASTSRRRRAKRSPSATAAKLGRAAPGAGGMGEISRSATITDANVTTSIA